MYFSVTERNSVQHKLFIILQYTLIIIQVVIYYINYTKYKNVIISQGVILSLLEYAAIGQYSSLARHTLLDRLEKRPPKVNFTHTMFSFGTFHLWNLCFWSSRLNIGYSKSFVNMIPTSATCQLTNEHVQTLADRCHMSFSCHCYICRVES